MDQLDEADGGLASLNNSGTFPSVWQGRLAEAWIWESFQRAWFSWYCSISSLFSALVVKPWASVPGQSTSWVGFLSCGFTIACLLLWGRTADRTVDSSAPAWLITELLWWELYWGKKWRPQSLCYRCSFSTVIYREVILQAVGRFQLAAVSRSFGILCAKSLQSCSTLLQSYGLQPARLLCPWHSLGKNTGLGCHFLLQGIFPTQGSNRHLLKSPALAGGSTDHIYLRRKKWEIEQKPRHWSWPNSCFSVLLAHLWSFLLVLTAPSTLILWPCIHGSLAPSSRARFPWIRKGVAALGALGLPAGLVPPQPCDPRALVRGGHSLCGAQVCGGCSLHEVWVERQVIGGDTHVTWKSVSATM